MTNVALTLGLFRFCLNLARRLCLSELALVHVMWNSKDGPTVHHLSIDGSRFFCDAYFFNCITVSKCKVGIQVFRMASDRSSKFYQFIHSIWIMVMLPKLISILAWVLCLCRLKKLAWMLKICVQTNKDNGNDTYIQNGYIATFKIQLNPFAHSIQIRDRTKIIRVNFWSRLSL